MNPSIGRDPRSWRHEVPFTIGLLVSHAPDRRLLTDFLSQSGHAVRTHGVPDIAWEDWDDVSLVVVDELTARRHGEEVLALKRRSGPLFLPVLVILPQKVASAPWLLRGFDDVMRLPVTKADFAARLSVFLRLRQQSQQQEALRREAEAGQQILDALMEHVPDGITIADAPDMRVALMSKFGRELIGLSQVDEVDLEREWPLFHLDGVTPATFDERPLVRAARRGDVIINEEWLLLRPDGRLVPMLGNAGPIRDHNGSVTGGVIVWRDITRLKREEVQIKRLLVEAAGAESRFRALFEAVSTGIVIVDGGGCITAVNAQTELMFGYGRDELTGRPVELLVPKQSRASHAGFRQAYLAHPQLRRMGVGRDLTALKKDGSEFPVEIGLSPVQTEHGVLVAASITDITERKLAEHALRAAHGELEQRVLTRTAELARVNVELQRQVEERRAAEKSLSDLSGRLLRVQDEERRLIGRELHDSTAQNLAGVAMNLARLEQLGKRFTPEMRQALAECMALTQQSVREVRTVSYLLHPPLLDEAGLASAVSWYADGFGVRSGMQVDVNVASNLGRLPEDIELALFRIVQESLTNAHRHSGSSTVRIEITRESTAVILEVADDGRGMIAETLGPPENRRKLGVGITGMRERMRQLGGQLEIASDGRGTIVKATIPIGGSPP